MLWWFVPAEDAQGAEGVPPARPALALVRLDRHPAGVLDLERPPAVAIALRRDQKGRLGHALVGRDAGAAQVVQPPQHVVVPPRREGEAGPCGAALAISLDHLARRPPAEEAALEEVLLPAEPGRGHVRTAPDGPFVLEQGLEHADRGVKGRPRRAALGRAVPAAVLKLLAEQPVDQASHVLAEVGAAGRHLAVDARLDLAR